MAAQAAANDLTATSHALHPFLSLPETDLVVVPFAAKLTAKLLETPSKTFGRKTYDFETCQPERPFDCTGDCAVALTKHHGA